MSYRIDVDFPISAWWMELEDEISESLGEPDGSGTGMGQRDLEWTGLTLGRAVKKMRKLHRFAKTKRHRGIRFHLSREEG